MSETPQESSDRADRADEVERRGLADGIASILFGAGRVKRALTKKTWFGIVASAVLLMGGVGDRSQGYPIMRWVFKPIMEQNAKLDSAMAVRLARIETKQDHTYAEVKRTQVVVNLMAKSTGTERRIRRELERLERGEGLFGDRRTEAEEEVEVPDVARIGWDPPGVGR